MADEQQKNRPNKKQKNRESVERISRQVEYARTLLTGLTYETNDGRIAKLREALVATLVELSAIRERLS